MKSAKHYQCEPCFLLQADVSDVARQFQRRGNRRRRRVHCVAGHRAGRQQAIPLRLSSVVVGGRRQGGPTARRSSSLQAPGLAAVRPPAGRSVAVLRETQIDQQQRGQKRTRACQSRSLQYINLHNAGTWSYCAACVEYF